MLVRTTIFVIALTIGASAQNAGVDHFEKKIRPVLATRCFVCHSASSHPVQGALRLDSAESIRRGGNSGPLIDSADPDRSLLLRALRHTDKDLKMPPGAPLPPEVIADFESWVRDGTPMPASAPSAPGMSDRKSALWSLKKPRAAAAPDVRNQAWPKSDIDRFILSRLEAKGLAPSAEADKRTLIRRATYDLTGLPPSKDEIGAFLKDDSPTAYEKLIDRLLASPHYGERWARHWLDVARYSDSVNDSVNAGQRFPWSYTYRDWVISALNEDLPYDRFLLYQLAADRVPDVEQRHLAALGFLSLGRDFPKSFPETVDDRIDAVTRGMLGLTVSCARCHDHKYDPIPTKDYYSLYSIFSNVREPDNFPLLNAKYMPSSNDETYQQRLSRIRKADQDYRLRRHVEMVAFFKTQIAEYLIPARDSARMSNTEIEELVRDRQLNLHVLSRWRSYLRESKTSREPVFRAWHIASEISDQDFPSKWPNALANVSGINPLIAAQLQEKRVTSLKEVANAYEAVLQRYDRPETFTKPEEQQLHAVVRGESSPVNVPTHDFESIYTEGDSNNTRSIRVRYNLMLAQYAYDGAPPRAMAVEDVPNPVPGHVFVRGNPNNPGAETPPRFLSCVTGDEEKIFREGSGRLELAREIINPENPLTARVIANRIWMHHFGAGLVRTPSDFGLRGDAPTHPELLDYLAVKLVESGWSLKKLHRAIMLSAAYRQSSADNEAARKVDPENLLLWRMNRRRLEIESLRDSMLVSAGRLDPSTGGLPFSLIAQPSIPRRTVYGFIERGRVPGLLSTFDFASPDQHAPLRFTTTVPQQALFFLNSPFVVEQAQSVVARPEVNRVSDPAQKIRAIYDLVFARKAQPSEISAGLQFINDGSSAPMPPEPPAIVWQYGIADFDSATGKVKSFVLFPVYSSERWQGGGSLPAPTFGKALIGAAGGEPGELPQQAVVRRWTSPVSGKLNLDGTLRHGQGAVPYGDGVRGRIVSSRLGEIASWLVNGSSAETKLSGITVEKGDTMDFIVDSRVDPENDAFSWAPVIKSGSDTWNAKTDFAGPVARPLDVWARYAQVLLQTNEFAFVD